MKQLQSNTNQKPTNGISNSRLANPMVNPKLEVDHQKPIDFSKVPQEEGAEEVNSETKEAVTKWARQKPSLQKMPKEVYTKLFGRKKLSAEQKIRQSIDTTAVFASQSIIGLLQRKIKGAQSRIVTRKEVIQDLRIVLRSGLVEKKGKIVEMTPAERQSYQQKKLQAEAELIKAKDDMSLYRKHLAEAMSRNTAPMKENIKTVREMSFIRRMSPSISKDILKFVEANDEMKQQLINLKGSASENGEEDFLGVIKGYKEAKLKMLAAKPKLATQVRENVFAHISKVGS